jgi:hypothetical protein
MFSLGAGIPGFRASFEVSFAKILPPAGPLATPLPPVPIPTIVPVSSSFFEADVWVKMDSTEAANEFCMTIYGLGDDIYSLLVPQQTVVHITLGYDDADSEEVMTGILTDKSIKAGDQYYEATLKGRDFVFDQLQRPVKRVNQTFDAMTVGDIAAAICGGAGVATNITAKGPTLDHISFSHDETPFTALNMLIARTGGNSTPRFSMQSKDGKLWFGDPASLGVTQATPITDGATSQPLSARGATATASAMDGQEFNIAGLPALRPSDLVTLGTNLFRIQSITHKLTRTAGYVCTGRALSPGASNADAQEAGRPSASLVARQLRQNLQRRDRSRPAVEVGDVNAYTAGQHTATLDLGYAATPDMSTPMVQATLQQAPVSLKDKPIASPFAFYNCGLVVPVYPKMRSLLVHGWNEPEDAAMGGFVWTADMTPPQNQTGDWWLCLPTQFDGDGKPTGSAINDLTTQDGQRVIQVKGMTISIGSGLLSDVGARPTPGGNESLTIESDDNATKVTFAKGQITMTDGTATVTIGQTKGQIHQIQMTDGTVKLTISGGKVSIGSQLERN